MHDHAHHHHQVTGRNLSLSILLNVGITVAQVVGGFISGSLSLLSDALHNFSDVLSLILSWVAHRLAQRKPTIANTFGYKRAEILAAFLNAATLIVVAVFLIFEAVDRFSHPVSIGSSLVIWLSLLGIVFNGASTLLLKKDAAHSVNMRSAYLHLLTDTVASVAVLAGGLLMKYLQWFWIDGVITLAISCYLIAMALGLLKSTTKMLLLFTPENLDVDAIVEKLHTVTRGNRLHHIHVWNLNDTQLHFEAHLECFQDLSVSQFNAIAKDVRQVLQHEFHIYHCILQPEFGAKCKPDLIAQD